MKHSTCCLLLIGLLCTSCATLQVREIKNLEKVVFDPLMLKPSSEMNELRIDIIRQTEEKNVNDSVKKNEDVSYHPLGFDLGNGLFYDLNENLCLRIDDLLNFSSDKNFELQKINNPRKNKGVTSYRFYNDTLKIRNSPERKARYRYHREAGADSIAYFYKNRMSFAIIETDSTLTYSGKRRKWDVIHRLDDRHFYLNKRRYKEDYILTGNEVKLENDYIVSLSDDHLTIRVFVDRRRKDLLLYTIEQSKDKLFIYDKKYCGWKIERAENELKLYGGRVLHSKYVLKP